MWVVCALVTHGWPVLAVFGRQRCCTGLLYGGGPGQALRSYVQLTQTGSDVEDPSLHCLVRDDVESLLHAIESGNSSSTGDTDQWVFVPIVGRVAAAFPTSMVELGVGVTMTPLVSAFFNELGRRLGSSCADWLKRGIKLRFKPNKMELYLLPKEVQE